MPRNPHRLYVDDLRELEEVRRGATARPAVPASPTRAEVTVRDADGVTWRVLDMLPGFDAGRPRRAFASPPHPAANGRCFIARDRTAGRKLVKVIGRIPADDWVALDRWTLLAQLEGAVIPARGPGGDR